MSILKDKKLSLSIIDVNTTNLKDNLLNFKKALPKGSKIVMAVKANAYGHGIENIVPAVEKLVYGFQIDDICELINIRKYTNQRVFILGYLDPKTLSIIKNNYSKNVIIGIMSHEHLREINNQAKRLKFTVPVHIAIDTGFGREGILFSDVVALFKSLKNYKNISTLGFYTHHTSSDELKSDNTLDQTKRFVEIMDLAFKYGYKKTDSHIEASGATLQLIASTTKNIPAKVFSYKTDQDCVKQIRERVHTFRIGISLYGHYPSSEIKLLNKEHLSLKPVLTWKTKVIQTKHVPSGFRIGYGETFVTKRPTKLALLPIGYSDGVPRSLSNKGYVLINGQRRKIVGRISMNMMVVDCGKEEVSISNKDKRNLKLNSVNIGDEVILIGKQGINEITAENIAEWAGTIQYEILTGMKH